MWFRAESGKTREWENMWFVLYLESELYLDSSYRGAMFYFGSSLYLATRQMCSGYVVDILMLGGVYKWEAVYCQMQIQRESK